MRMHCVWYLLHTIILATANRWTLNGKNIVVTGGTKGIGRAVVEECCSLHGKVFTCARNKAELDELLEELKAQGYEVDGILADVSIEEDRKNLVKAASTYFNDKIHILVNNVGSNIRKKAIDYSNDEYKLIMSTNLESAFFLSKSFHPYLKESGCGVVINVASVAGGDGVALKSGVIYAMTKAAMTQMTYNLACEWAPDGIRVNTVSPWYIYTPLTEKILADPVFLESVVRRTPMKRVGLVEEVSAAVAFLAMDAASYITGQVLSVDGGFVRNGNFD